MTGNEILERMTKAVDDRSSAVDRLLKGAAAPAGFLDADREVSAWRRKLERFRLESHVRFNGEQMTLASAEDLLLAYETLSQLNYENGLVLDALRKVVEEGYRLPYDDWTEVNLCV